MSRLRLQALTSSVSYKTQLSFNFLRTCNRLSSSFPRCFSSNSPLHSHDNPLGLPRNDQRIPPTMPRRSRGGLPEKRKIPNVKRVLVVSSGKGGVGKSTVAVNLALSLASTSPSKTPPRIGILDLDIFGPSIPKMMGLENVGEPDLTSKGALLPLTNHGLPCMSMGFLLPQPKPSEEGGLTQEDSPVVWRGLMVMKAVQQLLFEVDWRSTSGTSQAGSDKGESESKRIAEEDAQIGGQGLDVLVIDLPPGTGDVQLSLTQLVEIDAALVVSTPQKVALSDARKGVAMFRKIGTPIAGMVLNMSHFLAPDTQVSYPLFGPPESFEKLSNQLKVPILARLPLESGVSIAGDDGRPIVLQGGSGGDREGKATRDEFLQLGRKCWEWLERNQK